MCPECLEFISFRRASLSVPILVIGALAVAGVALYFVFGVRPAKEAPAPAPAVAAPAPKPVPVPAKPEPVQAAPELAPEPAPVAVAAKVEITYRVTGDCAQARVAYIGAQGKTTRLDAALPVGAVGARQSRVRSLSVSPCHRGARQEPGRRDPAQRQVLEAVRCHGPGHAPPHARAPSLRTESSCGMDGRAPRGPTVARRVIPRLRSGSRGSTANTPCE